MTTQARELAKLVTNAGDVNLGDDISLASDGAVLNFGADNDVTLTHVADTGLLLNSSRQLQFGDSGTFIRQEADGVLDLTSDTEIELNATTLDINANVDISGTLTVAGALDFGDLDISNVGSIALDTITNDGTNITLDSSGDIILDADGSDITLKDGGTEIGNISLASSNFMLSSSVANKDIIFTGNDGGSAITALTLDMSEAGKAVFGAGASFNSDVFMNANELYFADNGQARFGGSEDLKIYHDGSDSYIQDTGTGNLLIQFSDLYLSKDAGSSHSMVIRNSGNVGIGTTSPSQRLHVKSSGYASWPVYVERSANSAQLAGIYESSQGDGGHGMLYLNDGSGNTDVKLSTNGDSYFNGGNVGIGTASPGALLDIANTSTNDYPLKIRGNIDNDGGFTGIVFGYESDTTSYEKAVIHVEGTSGNVEPRFQILLHDGANSTNATSANAAKFTIENDGHLHGECLINSNVNPTGENSGKFWSTSGNYISAWNLTGDPAGVHYYIELDIQGLHGYTSYGYIYKDRNERWHVDLRRQAGTNVQVDGTNTYIQVTQGSGANQTNSAGNVKLTRFPGSGGTAVS